MSVIGPGVYIPAGVCGAVAHRLVRDLRATTATRRNNGLPAADDDAVRALIADLLAAAGKEFPPSFAGETRLGDPSFAPGDLSHGELIGATEAADKLGASRQYVRLLCRNGTLRGARQLAGGAWLIPADELDRYQRTKGQRRE